MLHYFLNTTALLVSPKCELNWQITSSEGQISTLSKKENKFFAHTYVYKLQDCHTNASWETLVSHSEQNLVTTQERDEKMINFCASQGN